MAAWLISIYRCLQRLTNVVVSDPTSKRLLRSKKE
jgi:hypothetical protein